MTTPVSTIVRGALQSRAVTAQNMPPAQHRVFEGYLPSGSAYAPTIGTPYVRFSMSGGNVDKTLISGGLYRHEGLFQVSIFFPRDGKGTRSLEDLGDAVRNLFPPGLRIRTEENRLLIRYSSKGPILEETDWIQLPITIAWRYYSPQG